MKFIATLYDHPEKHMPLPITIAEFSCRSVKDAKIEALDATYNHHAYACVLRKEETYITADGEKHTYARPIVRFSHGDGGWTGYK